MNDESQGLPLGRETEYVTKYSPDILTKIDRADQRNAIGLLANDLPLLGEDVWNCYEFSWLEPDGRPKAVILRLLVPFDSEHMVESKSLKLYLNSFAQTEFANEERVVNRLKSDLREACGAPVVISLLDIGGENLVETSVGDCLDHLTVRISTFKPDVTLLKSEASVGSESVFSHVFRSVCPVTGQPDHATISIAYEGNAIQRESLFAYLVSYREYAGFHEQVVERIYRDLMSVGSFNSLSVEGHFLRRGGIDINPFRSTHPRSRPFARVSRQ